MSALDTVLRMVYQYDHSDADIVRQAGADLKQLRVDADKLVNVRAELAALRAENEQLRAQRDVARDGITRFLQGLHGIAMGYRDLSKVLPDNKNAFEGCADTLDAYATGCRGWLEQELAAALEPQKEKK